MYYILMVHVWDKPVNNDKVEPIRDVEIYNQHFQDLYSYGLHLKCLPRAHMLNEGLVTSFQHCWKKVEQ